MAGNSDGTSYSGITLSPAFAAGMGSYTAVVADTVTTVKVTPTASHAGATVRVGIGTDLTAVASGSASQAIGLSAGANAIKVEVTAQDGAAVKTYTVTVVATDAQLAEFIESHSVEAEIAATNYDCNRAITKEELIDAIRDYLDGDLTKASLIEIIKCYLFGPPPPPPSIAVSGLGALMGVGDRDTFIVSTSNLSSSSSYNIRVEAGSGLAFDSACVDRDYHYTVSDGSDSASVTPVLHACSAGSHDVRAKIRRGTTVDDEVSRTVTVALDTSIAVGGLPSVMEIGAEETFTVAAVNLDASVRYNITIDAGSGLSFDAACGGSAYSHAVPSGRTSESRAPTARACATGAHTVNIKLMNGTVQVASASQQVAVKPPVPEGLRLNGHSPTAGQQQFTAEWDEATGAQSYKLRHAVECSTQSSCTPPSQHSWSAEISSSDEESIVSGLSTGYLYRVQVKSVGSGGIESDWSDHAAVYPTSSQPAGPVGSIPYIAFQPSHTYSYTICRNRFPSQTWVTDVENGISEWTGNIVRLIRTSSNSCADLDSTDPSSNARTYAPTPFGEIRVADDDNEFQHYCIGPTPAPRRIACARRTPVTGSPVPRFAEHSFIMFRRSIAGSGIPGGSWNPGIDAPNASCSYLYQTAVHEAGHALGLGHATRDVSVMYQAREWIHCEPRPYDVAAVMALYQSHTAE